MSVGREFMSVYERLQAFSGCLNNSSLDMPDGQ